MKSFNPLFFTSPCPLLVFLPHPALSFRRGYVIEYKLLTPLLLKEKGLGMRWTVQEKGVGPACRQAGMR
jgi:hypothetical protein